MRVIARSFERIWRAKDDLDSRSTLKLRCVAASLTGQEYLVRTMTTMPSPEEITQKAGRCRWQYAHHRREKSLWLARLAGASSSFGTHLWVAMLLAVIAVPFMRYDMQDVPALMIPTQQAPYNRPTLIVPEFQQDGAGENDTDFQARESDIGKDWDSVIPEPEASAKGYEEFVASSEMGATAAFMATGPQHGDAGMFGSRLRLLVAQKNAQRQLGKRTFEREATLRAAVAWIAQQRGGGRLWKSADGQPSARMSALALASMLHSRSGGAYRFFSQIDDAAAALVNNTSLREDLAFLVWARRLERDALTYKMDERLPMAVTALVEQLEQAGGWRSSQQREGLVDTRLTAWSLYALSSTDTKDPAAESALMRVSGWLRAIHLQQNHSEPLIFPLVWDAETGLPAGPETDLLWGAFAVVMSDLPEHQSWGDDLVREIAAVSCDDRLFADPERLLVHTLIRIRAETSGWESWLHQIENRLNKTQVRHGVNAGSWNPPVGVNRLEFTIWNTVTLHEVYGF